MEDHPTLHEDLPALLRVSFLELMDEFMKETDNPPPITEEDAELLSSIFMPVCDNLETDEERWGDFFLGVSLPALLLSQTMTSFMQENEIEEFSDMTDAQRAELLNMLVRVNVIIDVVAAVSKRYISKMGGKIGLDEDADELAAFLAKAKAMTGD